MRAKRREQVIQLMNHMGIDGCIIKGLENIFYLSGFKGSEATLVMTRGDVFLLTDFRYITYANEVVDGAQVCEIKKDMSILGDICKTYEIKRLGFDSLHITYNMYERIKSTLPDVNFIPLKNEIEDIRRCKDPDELRIMLEAIDIATRAFIEIFDNIRPGKTEKEIARELDYAMVGLGADKPSFDTIVASGERAALPHAMPTDKKINKGEAVIIDFGAQKDGYCSDETCTVIIGEVNGKIHEIYKIVNDARMLGLEKARPGMAIKELDLIVRGYIDNAGYGMYFGHGTGHGIGIAVHETPAINTNSEGILEENMVITIEPGIYIPHLGGVRLEDMVFVCASEVKTLTRLRKDMIIIH
ncbi:MAG TPA: Xaa-Pro peptidase family protein [Syntrophorhabdaceae bacterium]|nr:Xaa-Pro peptidase family protein [Syntrophorhabdaceae bacterium]